MFMRKDVIKKISMVIAGLALIVPLASVNGTSVSARQFHKHVRVVRVMKRHGRRARKHIAKHMRVGSVKSYNLKINQALNKAPQNKNYNAGFTDALNARVNHKLVHDNNYEKGYLQIIALDNYTDPTGENIPKHLSKSALNNAEVFYRDCILK